MDAIVITNSQQSKIVNDCVSKTSEGLQYVSQKEACKILGIGRTKLLTLERMGYIKRYPTNIYSIENLLDFKNKHI